MEQQQKSLLTLPPGEMFEAIRKSQLAQLVKNEPLLNRMAQAAVHLLANDKLRACDELSILGALEKAVSLGFRLEPEFGECYLIPRTIVVEKKSEAQKKAGEKDVKKSVCTFQIGYKGWKALCLQSGHVAYLDAETVYSDDQFAFEYGTASFLKHIPADKREGKMTHFYAFAKLSNGFDLFKVITGQDSEKSRTHSEEQYDWNNGTKVFSQTPKGIWAKHYAAMALRVPIKKLCAALPLSAAIENAMLADGGVTYLQKDGTLTTITPIDVENAAEQLPEDQKQVPANIESVYFQNLDLLTAQTDFKEVQKLWVQQDKDSPAMLYAPYVQMFFEAGAKTAKTSEEMLEFWTACPSSWQKSEKMKSIMSNRKKELANGTVS